MRSGLLAPETQGSIPCPSLKIKRETITKKTKRKFATPKI